MIGLDNLAGPRPALTDRDRRVLVAAWNAGARPVDLARAYGISVRTVHRYTRAAAWTVRPRHGSGPGR